MHYLTTEDLLKNVETAKEKVIKLLKKRNLLFRRKLKMSNKEQIMVISNLGATVFEMNEGKLIHKP